MRQSSIALAMGMLEAPFTSSAPSATNHVALLFRPHSLSSVESSTPVHSEQLVIPCDSCTVLWRGVCRFPAHSRKCNRLTDGKRFKSSMVKISGRSTRPWTIKVCCLGSMSGMKDWRGGALLWGGEGGRGAKETCTSEGPRSNIPNTTGQSVCLTCGGVGVDG